jgi:hypothetical protein
MRVARLLLSFVLSALFLNSSAAQQTATSSTQASQLLQQSLAALQGNTSLTDVTLSGTARRIAGSDDESGTGVFQGIAAGAGRMDLSLSLGQRSEVQNLSASTPAGSWSGPDGVAHAMAFHNLLTEPAWFFPAFAIARRLSTSSFVVTYVGRETHEGQTVEHVSVSQTSPFSTPPGGVSFEHLSQVDFFLDSNTFLPSAISFNIHPDNNVGVNIPVEIVYSNYQSSSGLLVPMHIQRYMQGSLLLDINVTNVSINTGLASTELAVQ